MRGRLEDVARAAGVSPKTVSRVLNDEANVSDETRKRVLAAMEAMDYRPHPSARSLAGNRSHRCRISDARVGATSVAMAATAARHGARSDMSTRVEAVRSAHPRD